MTMATTYTNLFRRKSLPSIFAAADRLKKEIDDWLNQAASDKEGLATEAERIAAELASLDHDIARVSRAKTVAADFAI